MIWRSLYEQVKDRRMSALDFIKTVLDSLQKETSVTILDSVFMNAEAVMVFIPKKVKND